MESERDRPGAGTAAFELDRIRRKLLDLTTANRLLHFPVSRSRGRVIRVVDELPNAVYESLVQKGSEMVLDPVPDDEDPEEEFPSRETSDGDRPLEQSPVLKQGTLFQRTQSNEGAAGPPGNRPPSPSVDTGPDLPPPPERPEDAQEEHLDRFLQTDLPLAKLEARLRKVTADANSSIQETGINILHLAFGFLEWYESKDSEVARMAPLILVPVRLYEFYERIRTRLSIATSIYTVHNQAGEQYILNVDDPRTGGHLGENTGVYLELVNGFAFFKLRLKDVAAEDRPRARDQRRSELLDRLREFRLVSKGRLGGNHTSLLRLDADLRALGSEEAAILLDRLCGALQIAYSRLRQDKGDSEFIPPTRPRTKSSFPTLPTLRLGAIMYPMADFDARRTAARIPERAIRTLVFRIARRFRPQRIILFGSHAYGRPTADSDVDLLVIVPTRRNAAELASAMARAADPPFPLDILVRTPADIRRRLAEGDRFVTEALERGKTLYEARHPRMG